MKDKGLYWEMIKMEIRAFTIKYSKQKTKETHDEEKTLLAKLVKLQANLQEHYNASDKIEMDRVKSKLCNISERKTRGTIIRSRARWYEHGERNSKYFIVSKKQIIGKNILHL